MKVNIEIECTPQEARAFMGLPDVARANDLYVDTLAQAMRGVRNPEQLGEYARQLAPMGQLGMKLFQNFVDGALRAGDRAPGAGSSPGEADGAGASPSAPGDKPR